MIQYTATKVFYQNKDSKKSVILNEGGARSSKSYSLAQLFIYRFFTETNKKFLICRKYMTSLKYSIYRTFMEILAKHNLLGFVKITKNLFEFTYEGNYLVMMGVEDPVRLQSTEFNYIWMEEAEEFTYDDYVTLKTRLSAPQDKGKINQIFLSYNPRKRMGYINKAVKLEDDVEIIKSTYKDNKFLSSSYSKILETFKKTSPKHYKIFALGEYSGEEELIYSNIKVIAEFPVKEFDERIYGLDFGYVNPAALLQIDIKDEVYYVTELLYEKSLTNADLIKKLKTYGIKEDDYIYCDSSEPARILEIKKENFFAVPSNKDVADGIDFIKSRELYSLFKNENFNNELENYSYKKDKEGRLYEHPQKLNDHLMDAMRYAIYTHSKRSSPNARFF